MPKYSYRRWLTPVPALRHSVSLQWERGGPWKTYSLGHFWMLDDLHLLAKPRQSRDASLRAAANRSHREMLFRSRDYSQHRRLPQLRLGL
jgi:hypothetical protein